MNRGVPCKYILNKENCPYGKRCRFLHQYRADFKELASSEGYHQKDGRQQQPSSHLGELHAVTDRQRQGQQSLKRRERSTCTDLLGGSEVQDENVSVRVSHQKEVNSKTTQRVCRFYLVNSHCKYGDKCRYVHSSQDRMVRKDTVNERNNEVQKGLPLQQDLGREQFSSSRNPPPLTLASFIGGRTHVQRPHKVNPSPKKSSTLREVKINCKAFLNIRVMY